MNMKCKTIVIATLCLAASGAVSAQSVYPGQHQGKIVKETVAPLRAQSFDLKDIRLLPGRFRENMARDSAWMVSLDVNRLLHSFRTNAGVFAGREGGYTGETCCTYNMLKLSRHLFCWTADAKVADYYERALYNHILGQQAPETGMVCYFLPLLNGAHKVYSTKENSFWCGVGSGFESHAKYGEATYPMQVRIETTPDNPGKGALLYGPLVLAGERGTEGMQSPAPFSNPALYNDYYTYDYHVPADLRTTLQIDRKRPERALQRVGNELKFTTRQGDVLRPLYDVHHQRYVVYWDLKEAGGK